MKKFLLLIVCVICLVFGSCGSDRFKSESKGITYFDLEKGEELILGTCDHDDFIFLTRKADSTYIPQEKKLHVVSVVTGLEMTVFIREH